MRTMLRSLCLLLLSAGCAQQMPASDVDMAPPLDEADLRRMPRDLSENTECQLPFEHRDIDKVTTGAVTVSSAGQVTTAQVDASAGGSMMAMSQPYVYLDLIAGKRVDISDVASRTSKDWDIALKRYVIKVNGGDSGPGGITLTSVPGKALADVTAAPGGAYATDRYFNADCTLKLDNIGGLLTAMSDWYEYETGTSRLAPVKQVYVLKRRDGQGHIKLQITSYYNMAGQSANYTLTWAPLP